MKRYRKYVYGDVIVFSVNDWKYIGKIININDYREPDLKYAIDNVFKFDSTGQGMTKLDLDDYVFIGDKNIITKISEERFNDSKL